MSSLWIPRIAEDEVDLERLCTEIDRHPNIPHKRNYMAPSLCTKNRISSYTAVKAQLSKIQGYISSLEYNFTKEKYNTLRKDIGMSRVAAIARSIIRNSLPIRCVEATFLAAYLTIGLEEVIRFPVHFRSTCDGITYRHIVLFIRFQDYYGSLGLSRKKTLMYKPLSFSSLFELFSNFKVSYEEVGHQLVYAGIGLPFSHSFWCLAPVKWQSLRINVLESDEEKLRKECETFCGESL